MNIYITDMIKLFVNSYFTDSISNDDFKDRISSLFNLEVTIDQGFDRNDAVSMLMLYSAYRLLESMKIHGVSGRVGLRYHYGYGYPGWLLIIETDNRLITPLVAKYFSWERIESHDILTFNELTA